MLHPRSIWGKGSGEAQKTVFNKHTRATRVGMRAFRGTAQLHGPASIRRRFHAGGLQITQSENPEVIGSANTIIL